MKTKLYSYFHLGAALAVLSAIGLSESTLAQGTAFTYQGRFYDGATPANGNYDMRFHVYSLSSGGVVLAGPITNAPIVVSNGLFTTTLDFGPGVFNGQVCWLQIGARTNGSAGGYTALSPRQQLTPTPYAIFAEGANAANLVGSIPAGDLSGVNGSGLTGVALLGGMNIFNGNQTIDGALTISDGQGATNFTDLTIGPGGYFAGEEHSVNFDDGAGHIGSLLVGWDGTVGYSSLGNLYNNGSHTKGTKALTVFGNGNVNVDPQNLNNGFLNNGSTNSSGLTFGLTSGEGIASKRTAGGNQYGLDFYTDFATRMSISQGGFVGIGRQAPVDFYELFGLYSPVTNTWAGMFVETGTGGRPFYGYSENSSSSTWTELNGQDSNNWEVWNYGMRLAITTAGYVGIGTTTPSHALEVANGDVSIDNHNLFLTSGSTFSDGYGLIYQGNLPGGIFSTNSNGPFLYGYSGGALGAVGPETVCLSWDWSGDVWVSNNLSTATLTIRGGSDLAEPFNISSAQGEVPEGAVVVIDEQNPGHLKLSDSAYDTHVAGVVSGAKGINPGIQMHQEGLLDGGKNVALTGRVYVQADASNGAIHPGDLLTTSSTPGYAMKVSDHAHAAGAILGKAMTGLSEGKGMVLVLVTLQ